MYRSHPEVYSFILILIIPLHNHRRADDELAHSIITPRPFSLYCVKQAACQHVIFSVFAPVYAYTETFS